MSTLDSQTTAAPLSIARSLRPVVNAGVEESEAQAYLSDSTVAALRASGLFALLVPACLGGQEADPASAIEVIAEVSHADGSAGWTLMAGMVTNAIAGAYLGEAATAEIFRTGADVVCAGQLAPRGEAHPVDDGYRIQGHFGFGSGSHHADWMFGGFRAVRDGRAERLDNGLPNVLGACVPRSRVRLHHNWDVMGLEGTGSYDYEIVDQVVAEAFTFALFTAPPLRGGALYRLGVLGLTALGHAGYALGVGRRALDEVADVARARKRLGHEPLAAQTTFQRDLAETEAAFRAARAYVLSSFTALYRAAEHDGITLELRAECRLATTHATRTAAAATAFAYRASGSEGLRNPSTVGRCFRDMHAGTQHIFVDEKTFVEAGQVLLGLVDPDFSI